MRVHASCPGLARLQARYRAAPRVAGPIVRRAVERAGEVLQNSTRPFVPRRSGRSRASVVFRMDQNAGPEIRGRLTVLGDRKQHELMVWLERGTRPHLILPRRARALRFLVSGTVTFSKRVLHPGTRAYAPFARGFNSALPRMRRIFAAANGQITRVLGRG